MFSQFDIVRLSIIRYGWIIVWLVTCYSVSYPDALHWLTYPVSRLNGDGPLLHCHENDGGSGMTKTCDRLSVDHRSDEMMVPVLFPSIAWDVVVPCSSLNWNKINKEDKELFNTSRPLKQPSRSRNLTHISARCHVFHLSLTCMPSRAPLEILHYSAQSI